MNALAAVGRIAVCLAFSIGLSAQTPTITFTPTGSNGNYTLTAQYAAQAKAHLPTGNVAFEDTTYSNAVLASAPLSLTASAVYSHQGQGLQSVSGYYSNVLARDFDGDGKVDFLLVDGSYHLMFLKGNGDGTFQNGVADSSVSMQTTFLTAGDWNGDGKLDIAASGTQVNSSSGPATAAIQVRQGNGDGTFQTPVQLTETIAQNYQQASLQSGDFNGDGKLDLYSAAASTNYSGNPSGHLYLGNGDGTFATAVATIGAVGPAADFNNDGRTDIYGAPDGHGGYATLLGLSSGTFQAVNGSSVGPGFSTVADFNGDGKLDVANLSGTQGVGVYGSSAAVVSLGNGDGTFQTASTYDVDPQYYYWTYTSAISGDFNGDGVPDLAFLGWSYRAHYDYTVYGMFAILFGHSDGTFSPKQLYDLSWGGENPGQLLSADTNGDGLQEALAFYQNYGAVVTAPVLMNTFTATATNVAVSPGGTHQVRAHYAGDANYAAVATTPQALTGSDAHATLSLAVTPNSSTYLATVDMTVTVAPCTVGSYSCDTDFVTIYDGSTAVIRAHPSGGVAHMTYRSFAQGTHVLTANFAGNSHLSSATSNPVTLTVGPPAGIVGALKLTDALESEDSHTLTAQFTSPVLTPAPTGSVSFLDLAANNNVLATATLGSPAPVFKTDQTVMNENYNTTSLYAGDFDNDGKADLIYPSGGATIGFLHGNGDGTFSGTEINGGGGSAAIADFNNDGKLDVIQPNGYNIALSKGNGDGTFTPGISIYDLNDFDASPLAGDFNGDGKQDVYNITSKHLFLGNGDGTFQGASTTNITAQLAGDFNQDGRTDLFATDGVHLGQTDGTFVTVPAPSAYSKAVLVFDFNHDGKLDVFTADNTLLLGNGDGSFQTAKAIDLATGLENSGSLIFVKYFTGDFNGDGKADVGLLATYYNVPPGNSTAYVMVATFGDGTGAFTNKTTYNTSDRILETVPSYLPDFNGDAASDIAVYGQRFDASNWLTVFTTPTVYTATATGVTLFAPPANHSIQAQYPGDVNYLDATSDTVSVFARTPVTLTLAVAPNPVLAFQNLTFTGTLSPFSDINASTNGELIYFREGTRLLGSGNLNNGVAQVSTALAPGSYSITASFAGDPEFSLATSAPISVQVNHRPVNITWPTPPAITYGTTLTQAQLNASTTVPGSFAYSPGVGTVLSTGSQTLSTTFTPTDPGTYSNATATTTLVVNKATPSIAVTQTSPTTTGTHVGTATVLRAGLTAIIYGWPTGTITFYDGSIAIGTAPVSAAAATLTTTFSSEGTHVITAIYSGDNNFNTVTSPAFNEVVSKTTPLIIWSTPSAINYGTALSATQLNATSTVAGSFTYSPAAGAVLGAGTQTLSVTFTPTDTTTYNGATATTTLVVNKTTPSITWATPAAITYGTALSATQLNATTTVAGSFVYSPVSGTVLGVGSQVLSAAFTPTDTANYNGASSSTTLAVNKATPSITVTQTSPITIGVGTGVATTFRAALAASYGTPTGVVGFYEGTTLLGSAPLINGDSGVTTTFSTTGVHTITALYSGDASFNTVTSPAFNETVVLFGIGLAANPTTLTIKQGQSGTATIIATPTGNYTGTLTFSCGNLPSSVSCGFAPATLTFNGDDQPQTSTITVITRTTSAALMSTSNVRLASILALPLLAFGLRRRRMLQRGLLVLFAAMLLLPTTGCGGSPTTTSSSAATGQQTVTINAQTTANGGSTQSFNFSIVIEP
ncbi:beta strand repeat-containing protein [Terriglobus sp. 2YAB30_2]|uniref:beta strand repeat-containing protein n=1 Tax=Terriglobus sp. 2YAB30_2 TaxID=3233023 RepID=UPI003F9E3DF9